ncbi:hypothetical protein RhiJN_13680 [Ceratobasidium sp. AG-Ba]|nr:hypothetical protein RhiJN_13680 [Ceratobasidium sp. AG-Ba]QRW14238.1 hypothetical protein RhiLY_13237 [Ceratobasidium sp. AG-Ba]
MDHADDYGLPILAQDKLTIQHEVLGGGSHEPCTILAKFCASLKTRGFNPPALDEILAKLDYDLGGLHIDLIKRGQRGLFSILEHPVFSPMILAAQPKSRRDRYSLNYISGNEEEATIKAWNIPYIGEAARVLRSNLDQMNSERRADDYANYVPIVQSSGTGKSRAVDELAQQVFTIPFRLFVRQGDTGYPAADEGISKRLMDGDTVEEVRQRQGIFFERLFGAVYDELEKMPNYGSQEALAQAFRNRLETDERRARSQLYKNVCDETVKMCQHHDSNPITTSVPMERQSSNQTPEYSIALALINLIRRKSGVPPSDVYEERKADDGCKRKVWLCVYFDESHPLTEHVLEPLSSQSRTAYQILCWVINRLRKLDVFFVFLSTQSLMSVYSPPQSLFCSARVINDTTPGVQAPICEMSFDCWSGGDHLMEPYQKTLQEVCEPAFMVRFGRPLFWTRYEGGDDYVKRNILSFARRKLAGNLDDDLPKDAELAVLMFRIGLSFDKTRKCAPEREGHLVKAHMITAYSIPNHREFMYAGASSEPILAEAAAQLMDKNDTWSTLANTLFKLCNSGMILKGERGELLARLLLTKAHDWAVISKSTVARPPREFTRPVLLADFLEALVGEANKNAIMMAKPNNVRDGPTLADSGLGQAMLNFTHWAKAEDNCSVMDDAAWVALTRSMAWQCCDGQPDVDLVTPLMLPMKGAKLGPYTVSAIFWQIKNRATPTRVDIDAERLGFFSHCPRNQLLSEHISSEVVNSRPYLTIVLNLGVSSTSLRTYSDDPKPAVLVSPSKRISGRDSSSKTTHPRYAISISGCSHHTFPNLIPESDEHKYDIILSPGNCIVDHARQDPGSLRLIRQQKPLWSKGDGELPGSFAHCGSQASRLYQPRTVGKKVQTVEISVYEESGEEGEQATQSSHDGVSMDVE